MSSPIDAYAAAGVDIAAGAEAVDRMQSHVRRVRRPEVVDLPGAFAGGFLLEPGRWREPVLVSGTDGVGTKLLVAAQTGRWDTIGIDAVAMCVNDIAVVGAEPLFFLDYLATGRLDVDVAEQVVAGIAEGCARAGCALLGGETAEMPGMYADGHADVAGFAVGIVERIEIPDPATLQTADVLIGFASTGLHSNGYSLARQVLLGGDADAARQMLDSIEPRLGRTLADELLEPTRIYTSLTRSLLGAGDVRFLAHITGGGIYENVERVLPTHLDALVDASAWTRPPVFDLIAERGSIGDVDMYRTFNMGIGLVAAVAPDAADAACAAAQAAGIDAWCIGTIAAGRGRVQLNGTAA